MNCGVIIYNCSSYEHNVEHNGLVFLSSALRHNEQKIEHNRLGPNDGHVIVMKATRTFGLGINKKNIRLVVQYSLPPDLSSWIQEFGQASWDTLPATACIVYSEDDIQHLCYWLCNGDKQCNFSIAISSSKALTYSYTHLTRKCHHKVVLEGFCEQLQISQRTGNYCDVCALPQVSPINRLHELWLMVNAINEMDTKGENKLSQYIHGSNEAWIKKLPSLSSSVAYEKSPPNLSLEWWQQFARQCSMARYFVRKVYCEIFHGLQAGVFSY